jgi:hypothetical protein
LVAAALTILTVQILFLEPSLLWAVAMAVLEDLARHRGVEGLVVEAFALGPLGLGPQGKGTMAAIALILELMGLAEAEAQGQSEVMEQYC